MIIRLGAQIFREMEIDEKERAGEYADKNGMLEFLHAIMYPHKDNFLETVKKYIDFSENKELWREVGKMTGLGMRIGEECWQEGHQSGIEAGEEKKERSVAFRLFEKNQPLEYVSDIIERPMEYTMELRREYDCKVHEESKYGEK